MRPIYTHSKKFKQNQSLYNVLQTPTKLILQRKHYLLILRSLFRHFPCEHTCTHIPTFFLKWEYSVCIVLYLAFSLNNIFWRFFFYITTYGELSLLNSQVVLHVRDVHLFIRLFSYPFFSSSDKIPQDRLLVNFTLQVCVAGRRFYFPTSKKRAGGNLGIPLASPSTSSLFLLA